MNKFGSRITKFVASPWFYPLALALIGVAAYGLMLPRLGYYWDDWEGVYLYHLHQPGLAFHYYAERPLSALVFLVLFPLLHPSPLIMQITALLLRLGGVLFFYYTLCLVWPNWKPVHQWVGALILVFPGFFNQPVSMAFTPHLATFLLFSLSLYLTARALREARRFWLWMPLAVVTGILQMFMMEYFVVLELTRPLLIWFILTEGPAAGGRPWRKTVLLWLPFLAGLAAYLGWRLAILPQSMPAADPNDPALLKAILSAPLNGLLTLATRVYQDVRHLLLLVWSNAVFDPATSDLRSKIQWLAWLVGLVTAAAFGSAFRRETTLSEPASRRSSLRPLAFGVVALFAGGLPVWMLGRQISLGRWSDRFALAPMVGAVMIVVFGCLWLFRTGPQKRWFLAILLAVSISAQVLNSNAFRLDWALQRQLYWQLAWRVPSLQPGTVLVGKGVFTDKSSYYDATYIVNLLFDGSPSASPRYAYVDVFHLLPDEDGLYQAGQPIKVTTRAGAFSGSTSQVVGFYFNLSGGCVRILDPVYAGDPVLMRDMNSNDRLNQLIAISRPELIGAGGEAVSPDPATFGVEPAQGWCYFFEKADLARQQQDWQAVLRLSSQAAEKGYSPTMGAEYLPFIEAEVRTGDWQAALDQSEKALALSPGLETNLCGNWTRFASLETQGSGAAVAAKAKSDFCGPAEK